ncbi:hypothetical protein BY996DRAFT_6415068 [Phakopsora pachyrhizi]|nr:hypothetical protein BY996DRAFT_6415068 [Phakopsora pachyrhizi]
MRAPLSPDSNFLGPQYPLPLRKREIKYNNSTSPSTKAHNSTHGAFKNEQNSPHTENNGNKPQEKSENSSASNVSRVSENQLTKTPRTNTTAALNEKDSEEKKNSQQHQKTQQQQGKNTFHQSAISNSGLVKNYTSIASSNSTTLNHTTNATLIPLVTSSFPESKSTKDSDTIVSPSSPTQNREFQSKNQEASSHSSKRGLIAGVSVGCIAAVIFVSLGIFFLKRRIKGKQNSFGGRIFSSNDSNRAVRDRSSYSFQEEAVDPFSKLGRNTRKPLFLRSEGSNYLSSGMNSRQTSVSLSPRKQSLKSQISPPFIEPPSPVIQGPLVSGFPHSLTSVSPSHTPRNYSFTTSRNPFRDPTLIDPHQQDKLGGSINRDYYPRRGSEISGRNFEQDDYTSPEEDVDPIIRTALKPLPYRPSRNKRFKATENLHGSSSALKNSFTQEVGPSAFPVVKPLNVVRRSQNFQSKITRRSSMDISFLDPLQPAQDLSGSPPNYNETGTAQSNSERNVNETTRISHMTRSSRYSQDSERLEDFAEDLPELSCGSSPLSHPSLEFVSLGIGRESEIYSNQQMHGFFDSL